MPRAFKDIIREPLSGGLWGIVLLLASANAGAAAAVAASRSPRPLRELFAVVSGSLLLLAFWTLSRSAHIPSEYSSQAQDKTVQVAALDGSMSAGS